IKVLGISIGMMREALAQAKKARLQILDTMEKTLGAPRTEISAYAPRLYNLSITTDKIRHPIGPGGRKIRSIHEPHGVKQPRPRKPWPWQVRRRRITGQPFFFRILCSGGLLS